MHAHLSVDEAARDAWLGIMTEAVAAQTWAEDFKIYIMHQLAVPADRVRVVCEGLRAQQTR